MKILVIEDEHKIAHSLKKGLEQESYAVDVAYDGKTGFDLASGEGEEQKKALLEHWQNKWQERRQIREEERKWFEENKIDWQKLGPYLGKMGGGFGKRGFRLGF